MDFAAKKQFQILTASSRTFSMRHDASECSQQFHTYHMHRIKAEGIKAVKSRENAVALSLNLESYTNWDASSF